MDTELKFEQLRYADLLTKAVTTHEETLEAALPDYCATASRILDATGQLLVREKQPSDGLLRGGVRVTVLYLSEEAEGLQSVTVTVPFSCELGDPKLRECHVLQVHSRLLLCEAKLVSGRKLYLRVIPELTVMGYGMQSVQLCSDAEGAGLQKKFETKNISLLAAVEERSCTVTQEFAAGGVPAPEEVLLDELRAQIGSTQSIGSKLVVKGELEITALIRTAGGKPERMREILPISQILDGMQIPDGGCVQILPSVSEWDLRLVRNSGGCTFGLTARIDLLVFVYRTCALRYIADLYSTCTSLQAKRETFTLPQREMPQRCEAWAEEKLAFGRNEPFVYMTAFDSGTPTVRCEDDRARADSVVRMRLLYLEEDGAPMLAERSNEVGAVLDGCPEALWVRAGSAELRPVPDGTMARVPLQFMGIQEKKVTLSGVVSVTEEKEKDAGRRPSLVLRRPMAGESLWEIAKKHSSTEEIIRKTNHMEDDTLPDGMLLIPCVKK